MKSEMKIISYMIFTMFLVFGLTMSASFLLADAWEQPSQDTPSGGFIRPVENEGDDTVYFTSKAMNINGNFLVGENFFVDSAAGRVGIANTAPTANLDVSGPIQLGAFATLPTCSVNVLGAFAFNTSNNMPYVCTNTGWQMLHADIDGDGRW